VFLHYSVAYICRLYIIDILVCILLSCAVYTIECADIDREWVCCVWVYNTDVHSWRYSGIYR